MSITQQLQASVIDCLQAIFSQSFTDKDFQINLTKAEFEGDYTVVLFQLLKKVGSNAEDAGNKLGAALVQAQPHLFTKYNVIKGFLNLTIADAYWVDILQKNYADVCFGKHPMNGKRLMVEYSSPNTNKPLHLGHLRNNFLGWSVAEILKASGYEVFKSCIVNDRGIHICKSMLAWQMFANGATPASTNTKGDHFVGQYYVKYNDEYKRQVQTLLDDDKGIELKDAEKKAPILQATQQMLLKWEAGDAEVLQLWNTMNSWVYEGFASTYAKIGSDFDKTYYESNTYLLGKKIVQLGLQKNVFYQKNDGSVWIDLSAEGLDEKLVLRQDGTSVYITQDIGLAQQKNEEYNIDESIYVIGDEQNYHMKVLKLIAEKLGVAPTNSIQHLSYGMVELPTGKMKSREGTVVDADDIVAEMIETARQLTETLGKVKDFDPAELAELYTTIGLGAMKFYLLRVDPKKKMIFNPEESIDFHGFTAPFVQYTYARTRSIIRKNIFDNQSVIGQSLLKSEKDILVWAEQYPTIVLDAAKELDPSKIANYVFNLAKCFNSFLAEQSIANAENIQKKRLRLAMAIFTTTILKNGMQLLGIKVPEQM